MKKLATNAETFQQIMSDGPPPLDAEYDISSEDASLLKRVIGIQDDEELKQHLLQIQAEAYAVSGYIFKSCFPPNVVQGLSLPLHPSI